MTLSPKTLFILLVIIILCSGLYLYKTSSTFNLENFGVNTTSLYPAPINFKIVSINSNSVVISFNPPPTPTNANGSSIIPSLIPILQNYMIVLVGLDNTGKPIGTQRIFLKPTTNCSSPNVVDLSLPENQRLSCSYTIHIVPEAGEVNYRIGVMSVYDKGISDVASTDKLGVFQLGLSVEQNSNIFKAGLKVLQETEEATQNENVMSTVNGNYEVLMRQLGNYPDNLYISQQTGPDSLSNLITKQLSLGIVDVNLHNMMADTS